MDYFVFLKLSIEFLSIILSVIYINIDTSYFIKV